MIRSIGLIFWLCMALSLVAADQFAADVRSNAQRQARLGLVNASGASQAITVDVFSDDGSHLGTASYTMAEDQRMELHLAADFGSTAAWAQVTGHSQIIGYVRYDRGASMSLVPITHVQGEEMWVSSVADDPAIHTRTVLVNVGSSQGEARSNPRREIPADGKKRRLDSVIPGFGAAFGQAEFDYEDIHAKSEEIRWDRIETEDLHMTGMQHLENSEGSHGAALCLPRTPYRSMIVSAMQPVPRNGWNKLVLINTLQDSLRVNIIPHYSWYGEGDNAWTYQLEPITMDFESGEKMVFDLESPLVQNLPAKADWYEIRPFEGGLIGYQLFGQKDSPAIGAIEAGTMPSSIAVLPYTPSSDTHVTTISVLNTGEESMFGFVRGYDDAGNLIDIVRLGRMQPYEKFSYQSDALFGDNASRVTWMRVTSNRGHVFADSVVAARDGSSLAGLQAVPVLANHDAIFTAHLERGNVSQMFGHGWTTQKFTNAGVLVHLKPFVSAYGNMVRPGNYFTGHEFEADTPYFFLGYEPITSLHEHVAITGDPERTVMVSPAIEVPTYGTWHVNYNMRMFDPQNSARADRYGMMWRFEGSDAWHWSGVSGILLDNPPLALSDCWVDIQWRNQIATVTPWWPMTFTLPPETAGRRIQLAYFYDHRTDGVTPAPWMFIDRIEISPLQSEYSLYYPYLGAGLLTTEELSDTNLFGRE